ncbi:MAG: DUF6247 family protein [Actinomycetota bacterium]|nr:DUF6247 family protein [Actinomycetota bacterium]
MPGAGSAHAHPGQCHHQTSPRSHFAPAQAGQATGTTLRQFEQDYAEALRQAREEYRLDKLEACLQSWRRIAWMTASDPQAHRLMLQRAQYTLRTGGDILPGSRLVSQEEMEERLRARLATG